MIAYTSHPEEILLELFQSAVSAADPALCMPPFLPEPPAGKTIVVGAGKAAASMAQSLEKSWNGDLQGLVVTRYGYARQCQKIKIVEAAHPVPDDLGQAAAQDILSLVENLSAEDLVLCLISGGGSALLSLPAPGIEPEEKRSLNRALLKSGATIGEINTVRKHLSSIKGGRLALAAYPAKLVTLAISDVAGDDPSTIASGPTVGDPTTVEQVWKIVEKYDLPISTSIRRHLESKDAETPGPDNPIFEGAEYKLIATPAKSIEAASQKATSLGIRPILLGDNLEGEVQGLAYYHAEQVRKEISSSSSHRIPCVLLSGGEATVRVQGRGRGGPNTEFALHLALALNGLDRVFAISCDTDGIDGSEENAGAMITPTTLRRSQEIGTDLVQKLEDNDSYSVFQSLDDLVITGPTFTNVNDFRAILIT